MLHHHHRQDLLFPLFHLLRRQNLLHRRLYRQHQMQHLEVLMHRHRRQRKLLLNLKLN